MTAGLPIRPAPAAFRISTASPILLHPSLFTVFRVVPTLVSHENDSQKTRVSSLAGMEVEPSTWYSSRVTLPSHDLAHWRLTSQPCLCSNHHSTWAHKAITWSYVDLSAVRFCAIHLWVIWHENLELFINKIEFKKNNISHGIQLQTLSELENGERNVKK